MNRAMIVVALVAIITVVAWQTLRPTEREIASGPPIISVTVPELIGDQVSGREAYNASCAVCHGADAAGQDGVAPPLVHKIYEPNHHGDEAFYRAATLGVQGHHWPFGNMPAVDGLTRDDVTPIIAYVRALQRANGIY